MDLDELQTYFMDYVDGCRINVENLPEDFVFETLEFMESGEFMTVIISQGNVPDNWVNNAIMNLQNRYQDKLVSFSWISNHEFQFELRDR